jgi:hypothetical protein
MATNLGKPVRLRNDSGAQLELDSGGTTTALTGSGGNLGIGTTSPTAPLHVSSTPQSGGASSLVLGNAQVGSGSFSLNYTSTAFGFGGVGGSESLLLAADSGPLSVATWASNPIKFITNQIERARITAGGYLKASNDGTYNDATGGYHEFRTTTGDQPIALFSSNAANTAQQYGCFIELAGDPNNTINSFFEFFGGVTTRAVFRSNGGLANYQSNNVDLSDARTKTDITPVATMWDKVAALEIVQYKYVDQAHDDLNVGVIAQQVEEVEPVWVDVDGLGKTQDDAAPMKTVYTKDITFAAIRALQEAMLRIEALEAKLAAMEGA